MSKLESWLGYSELGWKTMPIYQIDGSACSCGKPCTSPGKHPILKHGVLEATDNKNIVRHWAHKYPDCNVAVATGEDSGILVVDVDFKSGGAKSYAELQAKFPFPHHPVMCKTGNGFHLYFRYMQGIGNKVGLMEGIDVRSDGGYVLVPPSNHISGNHYNWIKYPMDFPMVDVPDELAEFMLARASVSTDADDYEDIIPEGRRNNALHYFGSVMRAKGISMAGIEAALRAENDARCVPPVPEYELQLILKSISRYERPESGAGLFW